VLARSAVVLAVVAAGLFAAAHLGAGGRQNARHRVVPAPARARRVRSRRPVATRPPQFLVVSFDGSGGTQLWPYWREIARRAHAQFTFFVSGVYLLAEERRLLYRPPRHSRGSSDIWFARPDRGRSARQVVAGTLRQIAAAYREGNEIGTHYNGHFCGPYASAVMGWTARDWNRELDQFDRLLFRARENNGLGRAPRLPFGPGEIVGARTPCLQGSFGVLYPVLARRGFRYDASQLAPLGAWPRRQAGIWSVPLLEIPFVGHTFPVVSMDYNFFANQTGAVSASPSRAPAIERETYLSMLRAFRTTYRGDRAPLSFANHFETWNHWAYDKALARVVLRVCRLPEVRCVSFRELVDWLDTQPRARLRRFRAGRFRVYRP
jgi:hypothetical protein